ncbi:dynein assembly factor 5, axonemal [Trichogramma pretiosum]|uniref:dynein assembly factor 5, axonemal n=1 Tax=Trichogramma pretiosum TaxID=7493 RepID=UPI0006C9CAF4|nr:dynein assembly factor 5, axonemal [Trichogramma pretiosum]
MPQMVVNDELEKTCESLQSEDKFRRKRALEEICAMVVAAANDIETGEKRDGASEFQLARLWEAFHRPLVRTLHDPSEACRDLALEALKKFLTNLDCSDKNIVYVLPILTKRLGSQELLETSEEVRLKSIGLLRALGQKYGDRLSSHFDDLLRILARGVCDKYPEVKRASCEAIQEFSHSLAADFYQKSDLLIRPILSNLTHRHHKIRVMSVETIGRLVLNCKNNQLDLVANQLAERLFDQSGAVRAAVVEVSGKMLLELKDRYSWWFKLVPLLLTGINDVVAEIRERASELWLQAGKQYIKENEEDSRFKEKLDYYDEDLKHYPKHITRPNLGCREIVQRDATKLLAAIGRELNDWMADVKLRAAQLLCLVVLNVEVDMVERIAKILPAMYRACNDEDPRVVENVELAAEYTGYFVPPQNYLDVAMPSLEEGPSPGHLKVLAALLRGSPREELQPQLERVARLLGQSQLCRSRKPRYQLALLDCCRSLLRVCREDCAPSGPDLFAACFVNLASAGGDIRVEARAREVLRSLAEAEGRDLPSLYEERLESVLGSLERSSEQQPEDWSIDSYEFLLFQTCLREAPGASHRYPQLVRPIFERTSREESDQQLRLRQYILLSSYLQQWSSQANEEEEEKRKKDEELFVSFSSGVLENVILVGLEWRAGRAPEATRSACLGCLCALLECVSERRDSSEKRLSELGLLDKSSTQLRKLLDDDSAKSRLYALRGLVLLFEIGQRIGKLDVEQLHAASAELVDRLEDKSDEVRLAATEALRQLWQVLPSDYPMDFYYVHLQYAMTKSLTHLDDPAEQFQSRLMECLRDLMRLHPEMLIDKIKESRENFINQKALDELEESAKKLLLDNKQK